MPSTSNDNNSLPSCVLYKPPHLRPGYVDTASSLNNNTLQYTDNTFKINEIKKNHVIKVEKKEKLNVSYNQYNKRHLFSSGLSTYFDCKFQGTPEEYVKKLQESTTLYIGNLNLASTQSDIHNLFSKAGTIKTIIMGIDKKSLGPGGFCFIEYGTRKDAEKCKSMLNAPFLGGKKLVVDWDAGFVEGRQFKRRYSRNQKPLQFYPSTNKNNRQRNWKGSQSESK